MRFLSFADNRSAIVRNLLLALAMVALVGCSSDEGDLHLLSSDQKHEFTQNFTQAYVAYNESGDSDIALVSDSEPRQLVHIRIFWSPMAGLKADRPSNANAAVSWCFVCNRAAEPGVVEYSGPGLVEVKDAAGGAEVRIRKAWMKKQCCHGMLVDPLGPSIMQGDFHAVYDSGRVQAIIAQIKAASNINAEAQAPAESREN